MRTGDIMSRPVVRVSPQTPVTEAASVLVEHGFSALPVVEAGRLVGIATEADLINARIPAGDAATSATRASSTVGEVMSPDPVSRTSDSDVADVVGEMLDRRLRAIPVVDDGALVGILTRRDVLRCVAQRRLTSADVWRAQLDLADRERG